MRKSIDDNKNISELYIEKVLVEDSGMDSGGVLGGGDGSLDLENEDDYAPGDNRVPHILGISTRRGKLKKKKKGKKLPFLK